MMTKGCTGKSGIMGAILRVMRYGATCTSENGSLETGCRNLRQDIRQDYDIDD